MCWVSTSVMLKISSSVWEDVMKFAKGTKADAVLVSLSSKDCIIDFFKAML